MYTGSIVFEDYPLEEVLRKIRALGFSGVEIWKQQLKQCKTDELRGKFASYTKEMGLAITEFNAIDEPYFQPFGTDKEMEATLEGLKTDAALALSLGVRDVLTWEGVRPKGVSDQDCMERLLPRMIELFREAISFASSRNVRFIAEPHPFTVGMNTPLLIKLCDALDSPHFGILYDCCHFGVGQPQDYVGAVRELGNRILHIHFSDSDQQSSTLHFPPGTGRLDLQAILDAFKAFRYDGTLSLDLYGYPIPVEGTRQSIPQLLHAYEFLGLPH